MSEAMCKAEEEAQPSNWTLFANRAVAWFWSAPEPDERKPESTDANSEQEEEEKQWENVVEKLFGGGRSDDSDELSGRIGRTATTPSTIQHIRQQESWDCGIVCLQMALQWLGIAVDRARLLSLVGTKSIWSIDLVCILQEVTASSPNSSCLELNYLFCSKTLSVNESLSGFRYYQAAFARDRIRVRDRFGKARELQLPMLQTSRGLELPILVDCLRRRNCIAIALVDNHILRNPGCSNDETTKTTAAAYTGHYIVLVGISDDSDHVRQAVGDDATTVHDYCLVAHNPGVDDRISYYTVEHFERAWRAPGTDEDIIFLVKQLQQQPAFDG